MTLAYCDFASSALNTVRKWYYNTYGVKITKKHALCFAINNINIMPTRFIEKITRYRLYGHKVIAVGTTTHRRSITRIKTFMLGNSALTVSTAISVCLIACAYNIKKNPQLNVTLYMSDNNISREQQLVEDRLGFLDIYNP